MNSLIHYFSNSLNTMVIIKQKEELDIFYTFSFTTDLLLDVTVRSSDLYKQQYRVRKALADAESKTCGEALRRL